MSQNDMDFEEFDNKLEDEDGSLYPGKYVEIGTIDLARDYGSGSYAEDGPLEVAEDNNMDDVGSAAMYGPTEIGAFGEDMPQEAANHLLSSEDGAGLYSQDGASELGAGLYSQDGASELGSAAEAGFSEIGAEDIQAPFESFMLDDVRVGAGLYPTDGASELGAHTGLYPVDGASELGAGLYPVDGESEIGYGLASEEGQSELGSAAMYGPTEIGEDDLGAGLYPVDGASEIGAAIVKVIEKARDNRQPPPPMQAVEVDAPLSYEDEWDAELTETLIGVAEVTGNPNPFPLTAELMQRCGSGMQPRIVRIDTEESYKQFRTDSSPELSELREMLEAHMADPQAHGGSVSDPLVADLSGDVEDLVHLGASAKAAEDEKRLDFRAPRHLDGLMEAWMHNEDEVGASMALPSGHIATTLEPVSKCVAEMARHAAQADVPVSAVVGALTSMGCVLGAATALKEMAAAAPSLVQKTQTAPCFFRIEPKLNPALCALAMLVMACRQGNKQACTEWQNLSALAPAPVKQAMAEAVAFAKAAA